MASRCWSSHMPCLSCHPRNAVCPSLPPVHTASNVRCVRPRRHVCDASTACWAACQTSRYHHCGELRAEYCNTFVVPEAFRHVLRHAGTALAMRVREYHARLMGWMPCHIALGRMSSPSYALVRCRALYVLCLAFGELARRVVDRAAALGVVDLDLLIQPAVA